MALSKFIRDRFELRYGCTVEAASARVDSLVKLMLPKKKSVKISEMVGRGYVHIGKGVNADQMDKESRKILRNW